MPLSKIQIAQQVADDLVPGINWDLNTSYGVRECPFKELHSTPDGLKDFMVNPGVEGFPPTMSCVHASCKGHIDDLNKQFRSTLGKLEHQNNGSMKIRLSSSRPKPASSPHKPVSSVISPPDNSPELPKPMTEPILFYLNNLFKEHECVCLAKVTPSREDRKFGDECTLDKEFWLEQHEAGELTKRMSSEGGTFVVINPLERSHRGDKYVTSFRHTLIEWDDDGLTLGQQYQMLIDSNLPIAAVVYSGGKSVHGIVRVDARDRQEYNQRVQIVHDFFEVRPDPKNKNPSRFSRMPGFTRGEKMQTLLAVNKGLESFDHWLNWVEAQESNIGEIRSLFDLLENPPEKPPLLIEGILYQGSKFVLGGGSKSFKSWILMDMALAVATGGEWWGHKTTQGKVLFMNLELQEPFFKERFDSIMFTRAIENDEVRDRFDTWSLRGCRSPLDTLRKQILRHSAEEPYSMIIVDPIYKCLGDMDENKAGDINKIMGSLEALAHDTGAAVVFGAHFSKGNQSEKEAIDRISGSGVFARDPDSILILTPHEEDDHFVVDTTLRYLPPKKPFVVEWNFPVMHIKHDADPEKLKKPKKPSSTSGKKNGVPAPEELKNWLPVTQPDDNPRAALLSNDELRAIMEDHDYNSKHSKALRDKAEKLKVIKVVTEAKNRTLIGHPHHVDAYIQWKKNQQNEDSQ